MLTRMNRYRFEALAVWARSTMARIMYSECSHWSTSDERLIGMVTYDHTDYDYGYIVLARDRLGRYRAVHNNVSFFSRREAENVLKGRLEEMATLPDENFFQGDESGESLDFFTPAVSKKQLHANFIELTTKPGFSAALEILREMANVFSDPDDNFVKDFQTTGFNARLWELYLFAALVEQGFMLEREYDRPDFLASKGPHCVAIEAVTVNPTAKTENEEEITLNPSSPETVKELLTDYMPLKFGSALFSKLKKNIGN